MDTSTFFVAYEPASSQWPAWVQAIGSLVGIAIAICVPWLTHLSAAHIRSDERRRKGHAVAVLIRADIEDWYRRLERKVNIAISEYAAPVTLSLFVQQAFRKGVFEVPEQILVNARELEYLDHAGELILQCMYKSYELNKVALKLKAELEKVPPRGERLIQLSQAFFPGYRDQIRMLEDALSEITDRFDLTEKLKAIALEDDSHHR